MESESTNGSQTACDRKELEGDDEKLDEVKVSWFRGVAARANFLSLDRMDIQYAAKEICRNMAAPTMGGLRKLKRLVRYLVQVPEAELHFGASEIIQSHGGCLSVDVYVDSDWAGCLQTRRSTNGGLVVVGGGTVKSWSSTQGSIALSSV